MGVVVRQKVKGKGKPWWVFVAHENKRKSTRVGDKTAAEAVAKEIEQQLAKGDFQIGAKRQIPAFGVYAREWLDKETHLKYSSHKGYESLLKIHLGPILDWPVDEVTRPELKNLISEKLKAGLSANTVRNIKSLISGILSDALENGLIAANPASRLGRMIKGKEQKADVNPLTREEARDFLGSVAKYSPRYYPFFLCALRTGMRLGELLALEWGDLDFRGGFIEVRRAHVKGQITTPKNGKSRRIDMSPQLAEILKTLRTEQKKEALAKGWGEVPELIFVNEEGRLINAFNLRPRVFHRALEKAGLRRIRIHDLRHTFASLLIQQGESLAYVRDQLGHSSIQITVDIYGHLEPGKNRQAVAQLDDDVSTTYGQKAGCI